VTVRVQGKGRVRVEDARVRPVHAPSLAAGGLDEEYVLGVR
jgi:hypothetical protein